MLSFQLGADFWTSPAWCKISDTLLTQDCLILNKLRWGQHSQSEKQWRDVLGVLKTQQDNLDYAYMRQWATELDLFTVWEQALVEAGVNSLAD